MTGEEIWIDCYVKLSLVYASEYKNRPKNFIGCFFKFGSVRLACDDIVMVYKRIGAFQDCTGDFSEWANKRPVEEKWKRVLAEILKIIHSIVKQ